MSGATLLRDLMTDTFVTLSESMSAEQAEQTLQSSGHTFGIIVDAAGSPKSVVTAERLEQIEAEAGQNNPLAQSAGMLPQALYVSDDLPVAVVLHWPRLASLTDSDSAMICLRDKTPVGIITRSSLYQQLAEEVFDSFSRGYQMLLPGLPASQPIEIVCSVCQTKNRVARYDPATFCSNDGLPYGLHHLTKP